MKIIGIDPGTNKMGYGVITMVNHAILQTFELLSLFGFSILL